MWWVIMAQVTSLTTLSTLKPVAPQEHSVPPPHQPRPVGTRSQWRPGKCICHVPFHSGSASPETRGFYWPRKNGLISGGCVIQRLDNFPESVVNLCAGWDRVVARSYRPYPDHLENSEKSSITALWIAFGRRSDRVGPYVFGLSHRGG